MARRILKDNISICSDTARRSAFDTNQIYFLDISTRYVELFIERILVQELLYSWINGPWPGVGARHHASESFVAG